VVSADNWPGVGPGARRLPSLFAKQVVHKNAPSITRVCELQKAVRDASRVSLEDPVIGLRARSAALSKGLREVDAEITWHDEHRLRASEGGECSGEDEDQFAEVFTEFYNWASERREVFDTELDVSSKLFTEVCALMGEGDAKEPADLFDILDKFLRRFDTVRKEMDEEKRAADAHKARQPAKKTCGGTGGRTPFKIGFRKAATPGSTSDDSGVVGGRGADVVGIPQRRLSNTPSSRKDALSSQMTATINGSARGKM